LVGYSLNRLFVALERKAMEWRRALAAQETV
jgi:hypothetical protein